MATTLDNVTFRISVLLYQRSRVVSAQFLFIYVMYMGLGWRQL
jgi:hypothetical protein